MAGSSGSSGSGDAVSIAILILLMFISCILVGYVSFFLYARYKKSKDKNYSGIEFFPTTSSWLDSERRPLIPGSVHTRTVQPMFPNDDGEVTEDDESGSHDHTDDFRDQDFNKLGRIIFVMRYHKKREELMVRLVQIEGLPVSQEFYSPNSAYVDVQLKYTGSPGNQSTANQEVQKPPRLDICLQQVYYFIITRQQMMSHSLEFQINTFDDQFRRYVSGMVAVNLCVELGDDILTGNEVVFVKDIIEPFKFSGGRTADDDDDDFVSAVSDVPENDKEDEQNVEEKLAKYPKVDLADEIDATSPLLINAIPQTAEEKSVSSSLASSHESLASNMSWEPEVSTELLSTSRNSIYYRCSSEADLLNLAPLTADKRSHSIGYLPTYEWTVTDIPLDDISSVPTTSNHENENEINNKQKSSSPNYYKIYDDDEDEDDDHHDKNSTHIKPPPESFYTLVPAMTPIHGKKTFEQHLKDHWDNAIHTSSQGTSTTTTATTTVSAATTVATTRKVAYKKQSKLRTKHVVERTFSNSKRNHHHHEQQRLISGKRLQRNSPPLERSSSWPSLVSGGEDK